MKILIKNKSSREIPEEVVNAINETSLTEVNFILSEYNLKIVELDMVTKNGDVSEKTYVLGDSWTKE